MTTQAQAPEPPRPQKRRSVSNVKAAASLLVKEARKILKKHGHRIAPAPAEAIRASADALAGHHANKAWELAEDEAERLDELLHQHASFARKSPLRETIENVGLAVLVALALRSCLYEPFKIPSGSMVPTLYSGDHIFVNKFVYGVQIPFTTTVAGQDWWGEIRRGDVVVFRYPINEAEDFIKRVIGLPGDTIRVEGNKVSIKRPGEAEYEELARKKVPDKCLDETGTQQVQHCELFEEAIDGRTYLVRYRTNLDPRMGARRFGEWTVPAGHLLVMGDNRNESHDSLAWTKQVEAVAADGLVSVKDLRDLTAEKLFTLTRPDDATTRGDASFDHVLYLADHASDAHGLQLEIWRQPVLGASAVLQAARAAMPEPTATSVQDLVAADERLSNKGNAKLRAKLLERGEQVLDLAYARTDIAWEAVFRVAPVDAVMRVRCGVQACQNPGKLVEKIAEVVERWDRDRSQDARQILDGERTVRYSQHWTSRGPASDKFVERRYARTASEPASPAGLVRLRAWRAPDEPPALLRDAALASVGATTGTARAIAGELGEDAWLVEGEQRFAVVRGDPRGQLLFSLECGKQRCPTDREALAMARTVEANVPTAIKDRTRLPELLPPGDVTGWRELPARPLTEKYEYDRIRLDGTIRDGTYSLGVWVWLRPEEGLAGKVEALAAGMEEARPDDGIATGAVIGRADTGQGMQVVFPVPATEVVVRLQCTKGLCPTEAELRGLAERAAQKAQDAANFIDPNAERPHPYVPRGNVKGRAERIWLPVSRFWLPIR